MIFFVRKIFSLVRDTIESKLSSPTICPSSVIFVGESKGMKKKEKNSRSTFVPLLSNLTKEPIEKESIIFFSQIGSHHDENKGVLFIFSLFSLTRFFHHPFSAHSTLIELERQSQRLRERERETSDRGGREKL